MKTLIVRRSAATLDRLRLPFRPVAPVLIAAAALIVAACNNGTGSSGY
jgi:hypothetical protein